MDFKKKSRPVFIIIFKLKNGNFKTQEFSPLIERVLAGSAQPTETSTNMIFFQEKPAAEPIYN